MDILFSRLPISLMVYLRLSIKLKLISSTEITYASTDRSAIFIASEIKLGCAGFSDGAPDDTINVPSFFKNKESNLGK